MSDVGIVPPNSARPCKMYFDKTNLLVEKLSVDGCKLSVDKNIKALNTVQVQFENMPENISQMEFKKYEKYLENLPLLRKGEVNPSKARLYNFMLSKEELLMEEFNHNNLKVHFVKL